MEVELVVSLLNGNSLPPLIADLDWTGAMVKLQLVKLIDKGKRVDNLVCDDRILEDKVTLSSLGLSAGASVSLNATLISAAVPGRYAATKMYRSFQTPIRSDAHPMGFKNKEQKYELEITHDAFFTLMLIDDEFSVDGQVFYEKGNIENGEDFMFEDYPFPMKEIIVDPNGLLVLKELSFDDREEFLDEGVKLVWAGDID